MAVIENNLHMNLLPVFYNRNDRGKRNYGSGQQVCAKEGVYECGLAPLELTNHNKVEPVIEDFFPEFITGTFRDTFHSGRLINKHQ